MSRKEWTDPAPLEVERPRLPWWTMLPRKVLLVLLPVLVTVLAVKVAVYVAHRLYCYPVLITLAVILVAAYLRWQTVGALLLALGLTALVVGWGFGHPSSFERFGLRQVRSEWRRLWVYAFRWRRTMVFADLDKTVRRSVFVPTLRRVRADGWRDRVTVGLLPGQAPRQFEARAGELAHSFGARACRVRLIKPRRIVLDLVHADPLAQALPAPPLAAPDAGVDLRKLSVGQSETGRPWRVRLLGNHILVAGSTGAGKASVAWSLLRALAPLIRSGLVQVFGIDPSGRPPRFPPIPRPRHPRP